MNIVYLGIFVLVVLANSYECFRPTRGQQAFLNLLKYKNKKHPRDSYNSDDQFYSSLLVLDIPTARQAIAERDHEGAVPCPYIQNQCDASFPWRTIDGSCNNLEFPWWGQTGTLYKRLLPSFYGENGTPRNYGKNGNQLANPRKIALKAHYPRDIYIDVSNYVPVFGQFIFHDISHFGATLGEDGQTLKCRCGSKNPDCINIPIPKGDYYNKGKKCLIQVRDRPAFPEFNCYTEAREQINELNSWIDLSTIYGNTDDDANRLRSFYRGRLLTSKFKNLDGDYLPTGCPAFTITQNNFCFVSGDSRVNQYPLLTSMHTIWMREHNRIADALWSINPKWTDDFIYQLARMITISEFQNIVYNEYLPILLGNQISEIFDLTSSGYTGYFDGYDPYIFPNCATEFSSAASRFGHVMTIPYWTQIDSYGSTYANNSLWDLMFNPQMLLEQGSLDGFLRGCQRDQSNWFSQHVTDYLSNTLKHDLGPNNPSTGFSLSAWNINRGREHGLRPYNHYRPLAGLKKAKDWDDLTFIPKAVIKRLRELYETVDDIDLWTGVTAEYPLPDAVLGPTSAYILARGFRDWKYGDRWWFENGFDKNTRFTLDQIGEIRKSNLARIICDNSGVDNIAANVFLLEGENNPVVKCNSLPFVDLNVFRNFRRNKKSSSQ